MPTGHLLQPLQVATVPSLLLKLPQLLPQLHLHLLLPQHLRLLHLLPHLHLHPQLLPKSLTLLTLSLTSTKLC